MPKSLGLGSGRLITQSCLGVAAGKNRLPCQECLGAEVTIVVALSAAKSTADIRCKSFWLTFINPSMESCLSRRLASDYVPGWANMQNPARLWTRNNTSVRCCLTSTSSWQIPRRLSYVPFVRTSSVVDPLVRTAFAASPDWKISTQLGKNKHFDCFFLLMYSAFHARHHRPGGLLGRCEQHWRHGRPSMPLLRSHRKHPHDFGAKPQDVQKVSGVAALVAPMPPSQRQYVT